ncbi:FG-GAP repeat protein [Thiotrichales bacterium 19X7-9]|nr:FG-GAP repeat protein [Thiotrichales bacterium 19X7-9]
MRLPCGIDDSNSLNVIINVTAENDAPFLENDIFQQVGGDIDGQAASDAAKEIAISSDGSIVALGAALNDGNGVNAGHVRVFQYDGSNWLQLGNELDGSSAGDLFGVSVSLSADGSRLAIGANQNATFGGSGNGYVHVFDYNGTNWLQTGSDIIGEGLNDFFGVEVSLSDDGNTLAVGANQNNGNGSDSGHTRIFTWNGLAWNQLGLDLDGEALGDQFGWSLSFSSNGNRLAIGAVNNDGAQGVDSGHVRVFDWDGTVWSQIGSDIDSEAPYDWSGFAVSLSDDGSRLAVGAYVNEAGQVVIYDYDGTNWVQVGADITGEALADASGQSVLLSGDGSRVFIGAPNNDGGGNNSGHVRIYDILSLTPVTYIEDAAPVVIQSAFPFVIEDPDDTLIETASIAITNYVNGEDYLDYISIAGISGLFDTSSGILTLTGSASLLDYETLLSTVTYENFSDTPTLTQREIEFHVFDGDANSNTISALVDIMPTNDQPLLGANTFNPFIQLGNDIEGEALDDRFGRAVAVSGDGLSIAVGAIRNDTPGNNSGQTTVYQWDGANWLTVGLPIDGDSGGDQSGRSVALNEDGTILAIGATHDDGGGNNSGHVRIFQWDGINWLQMGSDIDGDAAGDQSGSTIALNDSGDRVVIGARNHDTNGSNSGQVRVFEFDGANWNQIGNDLDGQATNDRFGFSVAMNALGDYIVVGAYTNDDGPGNNAGQVRIYRFNGNQWIQVGDPINGDSGGDQSGYSIAVNAKGNRIAIGAINDDDGPGNNSGHVRVFQWTGVMWSQVGSDIDGQAAGDNSGISVDLNSSGSRVIIGARHNDDGGSDSGEIRVYDFDGLDWNLFTEINGIEADEEFGFDVAISDDGNRFIVGAHLHDNNRGVARVYQAQAIDYFENDAAKFVFNDAEVMAVELGQDITEIVFEVTNVFDGSDERLIIDGEAIALTDLNTGITLINGYGYTVNVLGNIATLTITATLTELETQTLIDNVLYQHIGDDPTEIIKEISITSLTDNGSSNNTELPDISASFNLIAINDPPTLSISSLGPINYLENDPATLLFSGSDVSMPESSQSLQAFTLVVDGVLDTLNEVLSIDGSDIALVNGSGTTLINALSYTVSVLASTATINITGGTLSEVDAETLFNAISYRHLSDDPTDGVRVVSITEITDDGAMPNGGNDTSNYAYATTIDILAVNDPIDIDLLPAIPLVIHEAENISFRNIQINDLDSGMIQGLDDMTASFYFDILQVPYGIVEYSTLPSVLMNYFGDGSGNGFDHRVELTGTREDVEAILNTISYTPILSNTIEQNHRLIINVTDNGHTGVDEDTLLPEETSDTIIIGFKISNLTPDFVERSYFLAPQEQPQYSLAYQHANQFEQLPALILKPIAFDLSNNQSMIIRINDAIITSGKGSLSDPYVIEISNQSPVYLFSHFSHPAVSLEVMPSNDQIGALHARVNGAENHIIFMPNANIEDQGEYKITLLDDTTVSQEVYYKINSREAMYIANTNAQIPQGEYISLSAGNNDFNHLVSSRSLEDIQSLERDFQGALAINEPLTSLENIISRLMLTSTELDGIQIESVVNFVINQSSQFNLAIDDLASLCTQMILDSENTDRSIVIDSIIENDNIHQDEIQSIHNLLSKADPVAAEQLLEKLKASNSEKAKSLLKETEVSIVNPSYLREVKSLILSDNIDTTNKTIDDKEMINRYQIEQTKQQLLSLFKDK